MTVRAGGRNILTFNILPHIRELFYILYYIIGCITYTDHQSTENSRFGQTKSNKLM